MPNLADLSFTPLADFLSSTASQLPSAASFGTPSTRDWSLCWPGKDTRERTGRPGRQQGMGEGRRRRPEPGCKLSPCTIRIIIDTLHCIRRQFTRLQDYDPLARPARRHSFPLHFLLDSLRMASHHRATAGSSWATSSVSNWGQPATAKETLVAYIGTGAASTSGRLPRFSTLIGGLSGYGLVSRRPSMRSFAA